MYRQIRIYIHVCASMCVCVFIFTVVQASKYSMAQQESRVESEVEVEDPPILATSYWNLCL